MGRSIGKILLLIVVPYLATAQEAVHFDRYFSDKTMRYDYYHTGNARSELITADKLYEYGIWAGSRVHLIDHFDNGLYYAKVYDLASGNLLFSRGFNSYYGEYKFSPPALQGRQKTFHESILIPSPAIPVILSIESRNPLNQWHVIYADTIDPYGINILRHEFSRADGQVQKPLISGNPHNKVDIVILADGYASTDESQFQRDTDRLINIFFSQEPYRSRKADFNFYALFTPSEKSGIDEPRAGIYKQTILSSTFNAMGSERYILTEDNKAVRDLAAQVPYDAIYIMINHHRYGGGGIYNQFCIFTLDRQWMDYLLIHEFGHSFAGLADEYYHSPTAYTDLYPAHIEPFEPNITALLDPAHLKWKALLSEGVAVPTPWLKAEYDSVNFAWQKLRIKLNLQTEKLKKKHAAVEEIRRSEEIYALENKKASDQLDAIIARDPNHNKVGVFEGAGYSATGLYRSMADCMMFSTGMKPFCAACLQRINQVIDHYLE